MPDASADTDALSPLHTDRPPARRWYRKSRVWFALYVLAVIVSNIVAMLRPAPPAEKPRVPDSGLWRRVNLPLPIMGDDGPIPGAGTMTLSVLDNAGIPRRQPQSRTEIVLLLHGGPGEGREVAPLANSMEISNLTSPSPPQPSDHVRLQYLAPDLLGFGATTRELPTYSIRANAHAMLAMLDAMHMKSVHVVGWSQGGGVALEMCRLAPDRVKTLTLIGAIGTQANENSGSYLFEHFRYRLGMLASWSVRHLTPNFGAIQPEPPAFLRYFADSDQRPLEGVLRSLKMPVLVINGRHDFLVGFWAAREHARMANAQRLALLDKTHFMPMQGDHAAAWEIREFVLNEGKRESLPPVEDSAAPRGVMRIFQEAAVWYRLHIPWYITAVLVGVCWRRWPKRTLAVLGLLVPVVLVDWLVALVGIWSAETFAAVRTWHRTNPASRRSLALRMDWTRRLTGPGGPVPALVRGAIRPDLIPELAQAARAVGGWWSGAFLITLAMSVLVRSLAGLIVACLYVGFTATPGTLALGLPGALLGVGGAVVVLALMESLPTRAGRVLLIARLRRAVRFEFWPTWAVYAPIVGCWTYLQARSGGPWLAFTACNPGVGYGGGLVGESKFRSLVRLAGGEDTSIADLTGGLARVTRREPNRELNREAIAVSVLIAPGPVAERQHAARVAMERSGLVSRGPWIVKPDAGQRGFGVRRVSDLAELDAIIAEFPRELIVQPWHPGPQEVGVMWIRTPGSRAGRVFSVTRKQFNTITGDGRRTLEDIILSDPRLSLQARTFLRRHARDRSRVLGAGEKLAAGLAGNHAQGTIFRDGSELITPGLNAAIDALARGYSTDADGPLGALDVCRLDMRVRSLDDLRAGRLDEGAIIELNGTTGESTNIYDPDASLRWIYAQMLGVWESLFTLGTERINAGAKPATLGGILREIRQFYAARPGDDVAD